VGDIEHKIEINIIVNIDINFLKSTICHVYIIIIIIVVVVIIIYSLIIILVLLK